MNSLFTHNDLAYPDQPSLIQAASRQVPYPPVPFPNWLEQWQSIQRTLWNRPEAVLAIRELASRCPQCCAVLLKSQISCDLEKGVRKPGASTKRKKRRERNSHVAGRKP